MFLRHLVCGGWGVERKAAVARYGACLYAGSDYGRRFRGTMGLCPAIRNRRRSRGPGEAVAVQRFLGLVVCFWPTVVDRGFSVRIMRSAIRESISHSTVSPFVKLMASASALGKFTYH